MASNEGQVVTCNSPEHFSELLQQAIESIKLVVVDFTAKWCGPCRMMAPVLAQLSEKMPNVKFVKVDVDQLQSITEQYQVNAMPTFVFFKEGKEVDRFSGANPTKLEEMIVKHASTMAAQLA